MSRLDYNRAKVRDKPVRPPKIEPRRLALVVNKQPKFTTTLRGAPTNEQLESMQLSAYELFEMSPNEVKKYRPRLYAINKDGIRQYYTRYVDGRFLLIWRMK